MPSRRPDGEPRLVDRIRWGNLARLGAVMAAGLLVTVGPRACGTAGGADGGGPELPPDQPVTAPPGVGEPGAEEPGVDEASPRRARPRPHVRPKRGEPKRPSGNGGAGGK